MSHADREPRISLLDQIAACEHAARELAMPQLTVAARTLRALTAKLPEDVVQQLLRIFEQCAARASGD